ncbi:MAG: hypothetical protein AB8E87_00295, partial [Prochlorococcus sp.]
MLDQATASVFLLKGCSVNIWLSFSLGIKLEKVCCCRGGKLTIACCAEAQTWKELKPWLRFCSAFFSQSFGQKLGEGPAMS